jgi:hypothetical protein
MALQWILQIGLYATGVLIVIGVMMGLPALVGERHWEKPERRGKRGLKLRGKETRQGNASRTTGL